MLGLKGRGNEMKAENRPWAETIRREGGLIEHVCKHGVGHPCGPSVHWLSIHGMGESFGVHGCDGCCSKPEWVLQDWIDGCKIANILLMSSVQINKTVLPRVEHA